MVRPRTTIDAFNRATWAAHVDAYLYLAGWSDPGEAAALVSIAPLVRNLPVLDVGVGAGRTTPLLRLMSDDYMAVDYMAEMVETFRRRYPTVQVQHADARNLSAFDNDRFALVYFSYNGIDAVDHDGRRQALREFHRVLRPGGHLVFSTLNIDGPLHRRGPWWGERFPGSPVYRLLRFVGRLPFQLPTHITNYRNWWRSRPLQEFGGDWALRTLGAHNYGVVVHFTSLGAAWDDLDATGFEAVAAFDSRDGGPLNRADDLRAVPYFHLVARKRFVSDQQR